MQPLTDRFDAAFLFAHRVHRTQGRKGTAVPYVAHLMAVTALVLEFGGDEDQAIAALLHDSIEDAPSNLGPARVRAHIREYFGDDVLAIVEACTDTDVQPKPSWLERKQHYVAHIVAAPERSLLVSAADKLHNVQAMLRDFRATGDALWSRFNRDAGRAGTLGYQRALVTAFALRSTCPIVSELDRVLSTLEREAGGPFAWPPL